MEIIAFKDKFHILPILTFIYSNLNILSWRSPFDANKLLLDFWRKDLSSYKISAKNDLIWERYNFVTTIYKLCQQTNFVKTQVLLKCRLPTLKMTIIFLRAYKQIGGMLGLGFPSIKTLFILEKSILLK